jgi:Sugar (and other) transporter
MAALVPDTFVLIIGRLVLVLVLGVGVASVATPHYGAENAQAHVRGRFVSLYRRAWAWRRGGESDQGEDPGARHTFLLFAGCCVVTFVYVDWFLRETKGKTHEEVQKT